MDEMKIMSGFKNLPRNPRGQGRAPIYDPIFKRMKVDDYFVHPGKRQAAYHLAYRATKKFAPKKFVGSVIGKKVHIGRTK